MIRGKRWLWCLAALTGVAGGVWAMGDDYRLSQEVPASAVLWVEAPGFADTVVAFQEGPAWDDFEGSQIHGAFMEQWEQLQQAAEEGEIAIFNDLGIKLEQETLMRFFGQNTGFGLVAPQGGDASLLIMTKIDRTGLAADAALEGNFAPIWNSVTDFLQAEDETATTYGGYEIENTGDNTPTPMYVAMIDDVLALSSSLDTIHQVIDIHNEEDGAVSLEATDGFANEITNLESAQAYAWMDMTLLHDPARLNAAAASLSEGMRMRELRDFDAAMLSVLAADIQPLPGLAFGFYIPEGDLYSTSVAVSRSQDQIFRDMTAADPRGMVTDDVALYLDLRDLVGLYDKATQSDTIERVSEIEFVRWVGEKLGGESGLQREFGREAGEFMSLMNSEFEKQMIMSMAEGPIREFLGTDLAFGLYLDPEQEGPAQLKPCGVLRTQAIPRVIADIVTGVLAHVEEGISSTEYGDATIFSAQEEGEPMGVHWARKGTTWVVSSQLEEVQVMLDLAGGAELALQTPLAQSGLIQRLEDGFHAAWYVDTAALGNVPGLWQEAMGRRDGEAFSGFMEKQELSQTSGAAYVSDDFTEFSMAGFSNLPSDQPGNEALYPQVTTAPAAGRYFPAETFGSISVRSDYTQAWASLIDTLKAITGEEDDIDRGLQEINNELGGQTIDGLIGLFGQEISFGVAAQEFLMAPGQTEVDWGDSAAIPAVFACVELAENDAAPWVQLGTTIANLATRENGGANNPARATTIVPREVAGYTIQTFDWPDRERAEADEHVGRNISPCFAVVDGYLLVSLSEVGMERILTAYTEGPAMNDSPDFQRAVAGQPSDVMLRFHLNVGGILDQVNHNAVQIARNVASLPEWLKEPEYPEYPDEMADEDDYAAWEKAMDRYYEESSQFYEKAREWRIEHAEENSERVREIVNSCRVFGDGCMWMSRIEDTVMESGVVYRLNMDALPRGE